MHFCAKTGYHMIERESARKIPTRRKHKHGGQKQAAVTVTWLTRAKRHLDRRTYTRLTKDIEKTNKRHR